MATEANKWLIMYYFSYPHTDWSKVTLGQSLDKKFLYKLNDCLKRDLVLRTEKKA